MFRRILFASVAIYIVGSTGAVVATPFSENSIIIPSIYASAGVTPSGLAPSGQAIDGQHPHLGQTRKPGKIKVIDDSEIFSKSKLAAASLYYAPSDTLSDLASELPSELPQDNPIPSIAELVTVASLAPAKIIPSDPTIRTTNRRRPASVRNSGATVGDMVKNLLNRTGLPILGRGRSAQHAPRKTKGQALEDKGPGFQLLKTLLKTQLDMEFVDTADEVVNPSDGLEDVVTPSSFELNDVAFLASPVTNEIRVMDFATMKFMTMDMTVDQGTIAGQNPNGSDSRLAIMSLTSNRTLTILKFLRTVRILVTEYLLHPLTFSIVLMLSVLLSLRRMEQ